MADSGKQETFLVTGAEGFIGSRAVRLLAGRGYRVRALSVEGEPVRLADLLGRIEYLSADVSEPGVIEKTVEGVDYLLHFAALGVVWNPKDSFEQMLKTNVLGTYELVKAAGKAGAKKAVCAGSVFEYGYGQSRDFAGRLGTGSALSPLNLYGVTKAASSLVAAHAGDEAGIETTVLRVFSPYGPGEAPARFVPSVIRSVLKGEPIRMTGGEQVRDFCFVDDVADAFIQAALSENRGHRVYNLGTGRALSLLQAAKIIVSAAGGGVEILAGELPYRENEAFNLVADPTDLAPELRESLSTSFESGCEKTVAWMRAAEERKA